MLIKGLYELYYREYYMDYPGCCCPPNFETGISRILSKENEEKEVEI